MGKYMLLLGFWVNRNELVLNDIIGFSSLDVRSLAYVQTVSADSFQLHANITLHWSLYQEFNLGPYISRLREWWQTG